MNMCSAFFWLFFFFCPMHVSVVISPREANVPQQIYDSPVTPCTGISGGRLISSASCLQHMRSSFPALSHTGHLRQAARRAKLLFSSQSILRGLHCKAKEVLKEDTNRLILQLVSNPRKLKTACLNDTEAGVLQAPSPALTIVTRIAKLSVPVSSDIYIWERFPPFL